MSRCTAASCRQMGKPCDLKHETGVFRGSALGGVSNRGENKERRRFGWRMWGQIAAYTCRICNCPDYTCIVLCSYLGEETEWRPVESEVADLDRDAPCPYSRCAPILTYLTLTPIAVADHPGAMAPQAHLRVEWARHWNAPQPGSFGPLSPQGATPTPTPTPTRSWQLTASLRVAIDEHSPSRSRVANDSSSPN